ncbi:MAG: mannosyl-3-phosphoglycerate phosphatase [Fidelibacterota bacterium]
MSNIIIITDLDGTLLNRQTYLLRDAALALDLIEARNIPLIFCSSKTRAEQEVYRKQLRIDHPFIVEDGGAVFIEQDYFPFHFDYDKSVDNYRVIKLGMPYEKVRQALTEVASATGLSLRGYGEMTVDEVSSITGLDREAATQAMEREYQETVVTELDKAESSRLDKSLNERGLTLSHGTRFFGVMGSHDKRKATRLLIDLYRRELGNVLSIGIGDSQNDLSMLSVVDQPVLVQKPDGTWEDLTIPNLQKAKGIGPVGWNRFVLEYLT